MPNVTMEYAIMIPILLMQVILIPVATGWMMAVWVDQRKETALQDVASHLGSTVQQLYLSLNREEAGAGTVTQASNVPPFIESIPYRLDASDRRVENGTIIDLHLALMGTSITATTHVTLGSNALLGTQRTFMSNSTSACIKVEKFSNGTQMALRFSFG
ncbi:MAG: hypothetical protein OEY47_02970 [Candidatus Bathyarchaeota archaeon]|nr:hypothetical protein [Candidatus Bathyarchaeota archaeon]